MKPGNITAIILLLWLPLTLFSQNKPYLHFTEDDGLANNGVRSITKDQDGILWLGTENGISKYDGQKFINIRKSDGLPGNRVWAIASDHKSKIYAGCYKGGLAVIEKNRVTKTYHIKSRFPDSMRRLYYSDSLQVLFVGTDFGLYVFKDSLFYEMKYEKDSTRKSSVLNIIEVKGQIYFTTHSALEIGTNGLIKLNINPQNPMLSKIERIQSDMGDRCSLTFQNDTLYTNSWSDVIKYSINHLNGKQSIIKAKDHFMPWVSIAISNHEILIGGMNSGSLIGGFRILNTVSGKLEETQYRIDNQTIYDLFYDPNTKIIWACTDEGLIALTETPFEYTKFTDIPGVIDIEQLGDVFYILSSDGLYTYSNGKITHTLSKVDITNQVTNRAIEYKRTNNAFLFPAYLLKWSLVSTKLYATNGKLFLVTSNGSISIPDLKTYYPFGTEKFILNDHGGAYLVPDYTPLYYYEAVRNGKFKMIEGNQGYIKDILKVIRSKDLFLFASYYNGLYAIKNGTVYYLNESNSEINNYLTSIDTNSSGEIWCTSIEGNLFNIGFDKDLFIKRKLNQQNSGIIGDAYKWLKFNDQNLYLGTNKGLNIIPISELQSAKIDSILFFNKENGYDFISADNPFSDSKGNIYVRALKQLIKVSNISVPKSTAKISVENIRLNNMSVSLELLTDQTLSSTTNDIKIEFLLVKYPTSRNTSYRYRVNEGIWNDGGKLTFESVKPGNYVVDLEAKDLETGQQYSKTIRFQINFPIRQRGWFIGLMLSIFLIAVFAIYKFRINLANKRYQDKYRLLRENSELQIRSLQVQMNPHFIFNILNSIQSLIMQSKTKDALQYLGSLGSMIRMNLENVSEQYIPIEEEIRFLKKYIEIEELRFKKKFQIELKNDIPEMNLLMPPMLIQPIIENAIKHGVRGLDGGGIVTVSFTIENENLVVTVEDNGIGRVASKINKIQEHRSKGQELIEKRLDLLNEKNKTTANSISFTDLEESGQASGTKVIVSLELIWAT